MPVIAKLRSKKRGFWDNFYISWVKLKKETRFLGEGDRFFQTRKQETGFLG
ncbi:MULTISPECIES: hypothetical protein [Planktothricoides]|uniref:Uncharacterized protein n=2 Tax=Planktothricoides raciborskii TaxID=132608 RepID=A0AAU8JE14_9CYAN|nr:MULTISPECIES: hypothetical protein [Planktothricoides]MBD2547627.1 hypothetical protein [Planktothricoides raciborskii FACHB-1370]MBD2586066.1 hypothetical protein [Planktothricoides raciborskii FACHB-1261]